jgi:hypothetical protein
MISKAGKIKYEFSALMWKYSSNGGWYFVSLPKEISAEIRQHLKWQEEGWGRMKVSAQTGDYLWSTAIWYDTKRETYLLPIKSEIRKKAQLEISKKFGITIWI